jgi:hypothetical protein
MLREPRTRAGGDLGGDPQSVEREAEDAVDLLGVGVADRGDAADHFGDVGDVGVGVLTVLTGAAILIALSPTTVLGVMRPRLFPAKVAEPEVAA